jgi:pyruvate/2-oxoglutarate dehydrogenase complex dihydrolipoamide acyltransferase (E2) component
MFRMRFSLRWIGCALCVGFVVSGTALFAQDEGAAEAAQAEQAARAAEEARQASEAQRVAEQDNRQLRERSEQMMREFLNDTLNSRRPWDAGQDRRRRFVQFRDAFREFEVSGQELSQGSNAGQRVSVPARKMEKSAKELLEFVKLINRKHTRLDAAEFKGFASDDLLRETLVTASRLVPDLVAVIRNEGESSVDIKFLTSLPELEKDLLRLQWMVHRLR